MTIVRPRQSSSKAQRNEIASCHGVACCRRHVPTLLGLRNSLWPRSQHLRTGYTVQRLAEQTRGPPFSRASSVAHQEVKASTAVKVRLCLKHQVPFGQVLKVIGAGPQFGDWQAQNARELQWNEGHIWTTDVVLEVGVYEFKCVTVSGDHILAWEEGANRILQIPGGVRGVRVDGSWSRTWENRVTVTEPIAAASSAARQKRAAAARLLVKALADVNAAAAATGPSAAVLAGRRQAAGVAASQPGSKAAAAAALEEEALRELKALLSPEPLGIVISGNGSRDNESGKVEVEGGAKEGVSAASSAVAGFVSVVKGSGKSIGAPAQAAPTQPVEKKESDTGDSGAEAASSVVALGSAGGKVADSTGRSTAVSSRASSWRELLDSSTEDQSLGTALGDFNKLGGVSDNGARAPRSGDTRDLAASEPQQQVNSSAAISDAEREAAAVPSVQLVVPEAVAEGSAREVFTASGAGSNASVKQPVTSAEPAFSAVAVVAQEVQEVVPPQTFAEGKAAEQPSSPASVTLTPAGVSSAAEVAASPSEVAAPAVPQGAQAAQGGEATGAGAGEERQATPAAAKPAEEVPEPARKPRGSRFASLLKQFDSLGAQDKGSEQKQKQARSEGKPVASASASASEEPKQPAVSDSAPSGIARPRFSWRLALDDGGSGEEEQGSRGVGTTAEGKQDSAAAPLQQQQQQEQEQGSAAEPAKEEPQSAEEDVSARFARLLEARKRQAEGRSEQEQPEAAKTPKEKAAAAAVAAKAAEVAAVPVDVGAAATEAGEQEKQKERLEESAKRGEAAPVVVLASEAAEGASLDTVLAGSEPSAPALEPSAPLAAEIAESDKLAPPTPAARDTVSVAPVSVEAFAVGSVIVDAGTNTSSDTSTSSGSAEGLAAVAEFLESTPRASTATPEATTGAMGGASSREVPPSGVGTQADAASDGASLERLLDAWDAAWSQGSSASKAPERAGTAADAEHGQQQPAAGRGASIANGGPTADGMLASLTAAVEAAKAAAAAANKLVNGAAAAAAAANGSVGGSAFSAPIMNGSSDPSSLPRSVGNGESLYSLAERLTSNGSSGPMPLGSTTGSSEPGGSPDVTMRSGAMAAMGVDRQGSYDARSNTLSQSLQSNGVSSSIGGGSNSLGSQEQSSASLLRQIRAANAAAAAAAAAVGSAANGGKPAASAAAIPPLPATPPPPGILGTAGDDDDEEDDDEEDDARGVMVPPLPATPPPPSYLNGPPSSAAAPVPPLPATPVPPSVLSGGLGAISGAAEDLLARANDANAVLNMLRGNLPLTPVAGNGRGGAAGPLSIAQEDDEEDDDEADGDRGRRGGAGGRRRRRGRRGTNGQAAEPQIDPSAALAEATAAYEKARAALQALCSAAGLGLSPNNLSESAAQLLVRFPNLPKIDPAALSGALPPLLPGGTDAGAEPGAGAGPLGLPSGASQMASKLATGLGSVGSSLTEQLRRAGGVIADVATLPGAGPETRGADASVPNSGAGMISGLLSSLVGPGSQALPPGCLRLVAGAHMIPHVDKVDKGGEDAYFISRVGLGGVGVADGVSGWADEGIDPAEYPRTLMRYAADAYESARGTMSAQDIIRYAQYRTYLKGSSTVCMALMKPGKLLEVANVGDSGVRILRNGKVIFGTEAQQHAFNMPFQLSHPNNVEDPDSADDADVQYVEVQEGDVVMLATDGLFDNVFDEEIEQIVSLQLRDLAAAGRGKAPVAVSAATGSSAPETAAAVGGANGASQGNGTAGAAGSGSGTGSSGGGGGRGSGGRGLLSQSLSAAAAAAATNGTTGRGSNGGGGGAQFRQEDAARIARALAERAHQHARNPTQRTPWSVTSSQQPNFMWAKFFAKGGGKMDDCTVLVAFICGD